MQMKIRTYDEISSERVTVEVAPGQRLEIELVDPDDRVADLEADLAAAVEGERYQAEKRAGLELRVSELAGRVAKLIEDKSKDAALAASVKREEEAREENQRLIKELIKSQEATALALNERDRLARQERHRAANLKDRLSYLQERIEDGIAALTSPEVEQAKDGVVTSRGVVLIGAIDAALQALNP